MARHTRTPRKRTACTGKRAYTKGGAEAVAHRMRTKEAALVRAYECHHGCRLSNGAKAWHVGHIHPK